MLFQINRWETKLLLLCNKVIMKEKTDTLMGPESQYMMLWQWSQLQIHPPLRNTAHAILRNFETSSKETRVLRTRSRGGQS